MDGVIYHGNRMLPGAIEFIDWLQREDKEYLFLTNNSGYTPPRIAAETGSYGIRCFRRAFLYQRTRNSGLFERTSTRMLCLCDWRGGIIQCVV